MRIFVCFEDSWESFDISAGQTVGSFKQMVKESFLVQLTNGNQYLELNYGGAALQDCWALCDVGVRRGSTIKANIKIYQRPLVYVFNVVTGETLPVMDPSEICQNMSVAQLKTAVSAQSGLPVCAFRLTTSAGVQLYDCNTLQDYAIAMGAKLRLDTWDGWVEYLQGCLLGHRATVQNHLSEERLVMRFQLRVALYIAAFFGHLELADWLLRRGAHAYEPVGVHPCRQWCHQTAHKNTRRCPIHVAAENNQLLILKLFVTKNAMTLACWDADGLDPLKIAIRHRHRECVYYLAEKLCSVVSLVNGSLPMRIYLQMRRWLLSVKRRMASTCYQYCFNGKVLLVDGFTQPNMSSKPKRAEAERRNRNLVFSNNRVLPHLQSKLPVKPAGFNKELTRKPKHSGLGDTNEEDSGLSSCQYSLPPLTRKHIPWQAFVGTSPTVFNTPMHPGGRTARENAIYFLTVSRFLFFLFYILFQCFTFGVESRYLF
ncbi:protein ANKUB1-like isoform X1 [Corythoichthys intestinalis]|uniref:protein ANKUB1-like isoform X1 n=1 Tax=Corythoichthys intestinalis TaxID=161448 RepID=UPI0025A514F8|nr:protein ANKUB1-like isoform X1 [Corythoichthys intestinalis]